MKEQISRNGAATCSLLGGREVSCIDIFLDAVSAEKMASRNTIDAYRVDIEQMVCFLYSIDVEVLCAEYSHLVRYVKHLNSMHFAVSSVARKISSMRQFFAFLLSESLRTDNPASLLSMPKRPRLLPKAVSQHNMGILLDAASSEQTASGVRNSAVLEMLYATGMRVSELVGLKLDTLKYNRMTGEISDTIIVRGKGGKERVVVIGESAISKLMEYLKVRADFLKKHGQQSQWLFPSCGKDGRIKHITRQRLGQVLKQLGVQNCIDPNALSPHKIRHSFATHMLQEGASIRVIQELMGHSSINSTQLYTKVYSETARNAVLQHPLAHIASFDDPPRTDCNEEGDDVLDVPGIGKVK